MALGLQQFKVRQAMGAWAEKTVINYFDTHPKVGILAFPYGERWAGKRRETEPDSTNRPDLLLVDRPRIESLRKKGIAIEALNLIELPDSDQRLRAIVSEALVALEVKISFRYYVKKHVNFIVDEVRRQRYLTWLKQTEKIGDVVAWFTLDKVFLATMDDILSKGSQAKRTYENFGRTARVKNTWNMPVEGTPVFADVTGVVLNKTLRSGMKRGPTGGISFEVVDDPGTLESVDIDGLRKLAEAASRFSGK